METAIAPDLFTLVPQVLSLVKSRKPAGEIDISSTKKSKQDKDVQIVDAYLKDIPEVETWPDDIKDTITLRVIGLLLEEMPKILNSIADDADSAKQIEETIAWVLDFKPPHQDFPIPFIYACRMYGITREGIENIQDAVQQRFPHIVSRFSGAFTLEQEL